jgi:hypothetical protein
MKKLKRVEFSARMNAVWHATPLTFRHLKNDFDAAAWFALQAVWMKNP